MPVQLYQLSPQLASIQTQLRAAIANHQLVFGSYQQDPKNAVLRDKLQEMQVQIRSLSDHQRVIVRQLRGQLIQNAAVSTGTAAAAAAAAASSAQSTSVALGTLTTTSASSAPVIVTPSCAATLAKPVGQMAPRPQLLTLTHGNLGIVVPFAHIQQAQPTLVTLPGVLNQPSLQTPQSQPLVGLQLNASSTGPAAAAILTPPASVITTSVAAVSTKPNQVSTTASEVAVKPSLSVLRPIQPRPASPPIKVPHYTANNSHSSQGQQSGGKGAEKSNGIIHRSFLESDAKDLKGNGDQSEKDAVKPEEEKHRAEKTKVEFMTCIGLVTHDASKAIQNKRVERKRRSTANPHYSYTLERRRNGSMNNTSNTSSWLMGGLPAKRTKGKAQKPSPSPADSCPGSPDSQGISGLDGTLSENKGGRCAECGKEGQLLLCGTCSLMYHLDCLSPPLATVPETPWSCPACIVSGKSHGLLSNGALSMVNSYITAKANKEDDRKKSQRKNAELLQEKQNLLERKNALKQQVQGEKKKAEQMEKSVKQKTAQITALKEFVKHFRSPAAPVSSSST
ncbi:hypothetical protein ACOMHN_018368 [Nucella lapillus]